MVCPLVGRDDWWDSGSQNAVAIVHTLEHARTCDMNSSSLARGLGRIYARLTGRRSQYASMFMCESDTAVDVHVLYWCSVLEHRSQLSHSVVGLRLGEIQ